MVLADVLDRCAADHWNGALTIPAVGTQLAAITANLQIAIAGADATAIAILLRTGHGRRDGTDGGRTASGGTAATAR